MKLHVAAAAVALMVRSASAMAVDKWSVYPPSRLDLLHADLRPSCFGITAYGGPGGAVRQLSDGQNRIGDERLPVGKYCLGSNGGVVDAKSRGCILTPPTTQ